MISDLSITNIAIIESLQISFSPGLTLLTGETGAGKSIIIDAVGLIMGGRASTELIRSGEEEAVVEALFQVNDAPLLNRLLDEAGFGSGDELLVKRSISRNGKNRIFINGSLATLALLTDVSRHLINIYGQHESQSLLRPENQLLLLDAYGGLNQLRDRFGALYRELQMVRERLERFDREEREAVRRLDLLGFQSGEITSAALRAGEEEELEEQQLMLSNAGRLAATSAEAFERLYGGDGALLGQLRRISGSIGDLAAIDRSLEQTAASLEEGYLQLEDAAITLRDYASRIESDPDALQRVEDRLDLIGRMKKKYGATIEDVLEYGRQVEAELAALKGREADHCLLDQERARLERELENCGTELSDCRRKAGKNLATALEGEVHQLAMPNAVLEVSLLPLDEPRSSGFERVEFLFSPNPGEEARPLAKVASGGELSRLMLALKQVLPEGDVPTLVFDEVDTGIGGATAELVGAKLKNVSRRQQVLCITHLPQVAAFADQHLHVEKRVAGGRTSTAVTLLGDGERVEELARMLGGSSITETTRRHARELLGSARTR